MASLLRAGTASRLLRHLMILIFGAAALTLAGCGSGKLANVPYAPANFGAPQAEAIDVAQGEARIAPFDKLEIKVFQVEDLSGQFQVNSAGQIQFPLIGLVMAKDKTPDELSRTIATQLSAKYLKSPKVQVNIQEAAAIERTVTVDGVVKEPGAFPVKGPITLMRAVALARGLGEGANPKRVIVFRTIEGKRMAAGFDLAAIRRAEAEDPAIYPNDVVVVDGRDYTFRTWFGTVLQTIPVLAIFRPF